MWQHSARLRVGTVATLLLLCFGVGSVFGDNVDLTMKELFAYSDHIFVGTVTGLEFVDVPNQHHPDKWVNRHWKLNVTVGKQIFKTLVNPHENPPHGHDDERVRPGMKIHVMLWKAWKRPDTYRGPLGVRTLPNVGDVKSFFTRYLHRDPIQRSMYHESFPHVDEESEDAFEEDDGENYAHSVSHSVSTEAHANNDGAEASTSGDKVVGDGATKSASKSRTPAELEALKKKREAEWSAGMRPGTRVTTHKKAYNAMIPNGIESVDYLVKDSYALHYLDHHTNPNHIHNEKDEL
jgi:hypothetical protein